MSKIKLIADSTCDLPDKIIKANDIEVVSLYVNIGEKSFADRVELTPTKMYEMVDSGSEFPKTNAVSDQAFAEVFEKYTKEGYDIIYVGIGSGFSRTMHSAMMAKDELGNENIHLVDSKNLSSASGLLVLKAAKYIKDGLSAADAAKKLEEDAEKLRTQFCIETLDYLHKGGRCSGTAKLFGTLLKLRPIIAVRNGSMSAIAKKRGAMTAAYDYLLSIIEEEAENVCQENIILTHSLAPQAAEYMTEALKEIFPKAKIIEAEAGTVISAHCGRGGIGLIYSLK